MGEMINARCSECGYASGTLMFGGGMMAMWGVSDSVYDENSVKTGDMLELPTICRQLRLPALRRGDK